jgi:hypothetical protein
VAIEDDILRLLLGQKIRGADAEWHIYDEDGNHLADPGGVIWRGVIGVLLMWANIEEEELTDEEMLSVGGAVGKMVWSRTEDLLRRVNQHFRTRLYPRDRPKQKIAYRSKAAGTEKGVVAGFRRPADNRKIDWSRIFDPPQQPTAVPPVAVVNKIPRILDQYDGAGVALRTEADTLSQQQLLSAVVGPDPVAIVRKRNEQALAMILMEMM